MTRPRRNGHPLAPPCAPCRGPLPEAEPAPAPPAPGSPARRIPPRVRGSRPWRRRPSQARGNEPASSPMTRRGCSVTMKCSWSVSRKCPMSAQMSGKSGSAMWAW